MRSTGDQTEDEIRAGRKRIKAHQKAGSSTQKRMPCFFFLVGIGYEQRDFAICCAKHIINTFFCLYLTLRVHESMSNLVYIQLLFPHVFRSNFGWPVGARDMSEKVSEDDIPLSELAMREWVRIEKKKRRNSGYQRQGEEDDNPAFVFFSLCTLLALFTPCGMASLTDSM